MSAYLLDPKKVWECPSCGARHQTTEPRPHTPYHSCPALSGFAAPFVELTGSELNRRAQRHVLMEREDFVGAEQGVNTDEQGRAIMALRTERADGSNDTAVYAPIVVAHIGVLRD